MKATPLICHVTVGHPPTDDRIFHKEASSLAQAGYRVVIVAPQTAEPLPSVANLQFRLFRPSGFWRNLRQAYRLAQTVRADLYHLHEFELLPLGIWLKYKYRCKVIYDAHESVFWFFMDFSRRSWIIRCLAGGVAQSIEWLGMRGTDYLITVTPWVEAHLRRFHRRRAIVYNYPISDYFQPATQPPTQPVVLYHGQLVPGRNIELMIAAMAIVGRAFPAARLWLVGHIKPAYRQVLEQLIAELGLQAQVEILPPVPYTQVPELLAQATIGLAALQLNESYRRSIQVKPFEFMAMSLPVLGAKVPSINQFVVASGAGLIVEPLTPESLAGQLIYLLQNPAVRAQMGRRGRQAVLTKYNWQKTLPTLLQVYRELLSC